MADEALIKAASAVGGLSAAITIARISLDVILQEDDITPDIRDRLTEVRDGLEASQEKYDNDQNTDPI